MTGDDTTAMDAVLHCDSERLQLLQEEHDLMEALNATDPQAAAAAVTAAGEQQQQQQKGGGTAAAAAAGVTGVQEVAAGAPGSSLALTLRLTEVSKRLIEIGWWVGAVHVESAHLIASSLPDVTDAATVLPPLPSLSARRRCLRRPGAGGGRAGGPVLHAGNATQAHQVVFGGLAHARGAGAGALRGAR